MYKQQYHHLNIIELSATALLKNHQALQQSQPHASICPVIKSNAYGHGLKALAPLFDRLNSPFLVVDSLYEAYELYKCSVKTPVLILGYTIPDNYKIKKLPFHFTLFDVETAQMLSRYQPGCSVHIFVDTGMSREGISLVDLPLFIEQIKSLHLHIVGLASHFADADNVISQVNTHKQIKQYKRALTIFNNAGITPKWRHISASGGAFKVIDNTFNMIRAGIASYGVSPLDERDKDSNKIDLHPILTLKTHIAQIKNIGKGALVGYNGTYKSPSERKIALLPLGYYDGLNRRLSNKGIVQIQGINCPIVGNISMNITTIDVSHIKDVKVGEEVIVYSSLSSDKNSIKNAAKAIGMSPYELLVKLAESTYRKVTP
jgi:alanine racemase